jgi:hypothetical protein
MMIKNQIFKFREKLARVREAKKSKVLLRCTEADHSAVP